jgi:hypothetical protein
MIRYLDSNNPIILSIEELAHFVVIVGYYSDDEDTLFYIHDPSGALLNDIYGNDTRHPNIAMPVSWNKLNEYIHFFKLETSMGMPKDVDSKCRGFSKSTAWLFVV